MRKSRSSHIKCDCGEKTHKCAHLQPTIEGHKDTCCCNHGGRCTCSHKKEPSLDPVPESESEAEPLAVKPKASSSSSSRRRRATTSHSEPLLSFNENGHHKPTHKHTRPSQNCGPYTLKRGATMHGTGTASLINQSVDNLAHYGKTTDRSQTATSASSSGLDARLVKSEQTSPLIGGTSSFQQLNGQLPPLDLSNIQYPEYTPSFDLFGSNGLSDPEAPIFSAGLSAVSVDWTQYDGLERTQYDGLELNGDSLASSSFDPMQAYARFDLAGSVEPTLTSNSGDVSEAEDFQSAFNDTPLDGFRSGAPGSYLSMPESLVTSNDLSNLDFDQFKGTAAASKFMSLATPLEEAGYVEEDTYWGMSNFNDGISHSPDPITTALWDSI
ncbi:hypothetical protein HD806DRAFT_206542 [Xylariaceae sp. AK1471]|nr:hypothetical protein HD806DRAFT_206542 [Xylariaceae sp. AK1471]